VQQSGKTCLGEESAGDLRRRIFPTGKDRDSLSPEKPSSFCFYASVCPCAAYRQAKLRSPKSQVNGSRRMPQQLPCKRQSIFWPTASIGTVCRARRQIKPPVDQCCSIGNRGFSSAQARRDFDRRKWLAIASVGASPPSLAVCSRSTRS